MGTIFYFFHFLTFLKVTVTLNGEQGHKPIHFLLFLVTDYLCVKFHDSAIYSSWVHNFAFLGLSTLGGKMAKRGKSRCLWAVSYDLDCCFYRFDPNNDLRPYRLQQKNCSMPQKMIITIISMTWKMIMIVTALNTLCCGKKLNMSKIIVN